MTFVSQKLVKLCTRKVSFNKNSIVNVWHKIFPKKTTAFFAPQERTLCGDHSIGGTDFEFDDCF